jgi:hypothetical protein
MTGRNIRLTITFGNPSAVIVTAAYIAPEAPREGMISGTVCPNNLPLAAAVTVADAAPDSEIFDIRRGNIIRVAAMWETSPEKRPAEG